MLCYHGPSGQPATPTGLARVPISLTCFRRVTNFRAHRNCKACSKRASAFRCRASEWASADCLSALSAPIVGAQSSKLKKAAASLGTCANPVLSLHIWHVQLQEIMPQRCNVEGKIWQPGCRTFLGLQKGKKLSSCAAPLICGSPGMRFCDEI